MIRLEHRGQLSLVLLDRPELRNAPRATRAWLREREHTALAIPVGRGLDVSLFLAGRLEERQHLATLAPRG